MSYQIGSNSHVEKYIGKIIPGKDPKSQGRYYVQIPNLMQYNNTEDGTASGILCKNRIHKNRMTVLSDGTSYGHYYPLQVGTSVMVEFHDQDYNIGYIVETISDHEVGSMPSTNVDDPAEGKMSTEDRDNITTIFKTRNNCRMDVFEGAEATSFNNHEVKAEENPDTKLLEVKKETKKAAAKEGISIKYKDLASHVDLNNDGVQIITGATILIQANGTVNIYAGPSVNIIAGTINIQGTVNITGPVNITGATNITGDTSISGTTNSSGDVTSPAFHGVADVAKALGGGK